jgi:hypothetical protein
MNIHFQPADTYHIYGLEYLFKKFILWHIQNSNIKEIVTQDELDNQTQNFVHTTIVCMCKVSTLTAEQ